MFDSVRKWYHLVYDPAEKQQIFQALFSDDKRLQFTEVGAFNPMSD